MRFSIGPISGLKRLGFSAGEAPRRYGGSAYRKLPPRHQSQRYGEGLFVIVPRGNMPQEDEDIAKVGAAVFR